MGKRNTTENNPHYQIKPAQFIHQWREDNPPPPTYVDRDKVIQLHEWGWTAKEIAYRLDTTRNNVWHILRQWKRGVL